MKARLTPEGLLFIPEADCEKKAIESFQYHPPRFQESRTVIDNATGLMWQQSGSEECIVYEDAEDYIKQLNQERFAGYSDWRLPTVDELKTLLESEENKDGLYINPLFDKKQDWIMTQKDSSGSAWFVGFNYGEVLWTNLQLIDLYVRAVRFRQ